MGTPLGADTAVNRVVLSGTVCEPLVRKIGPAGTPHCQFVLAHRSQQREAGFARQAWCRVPVVISGQSANKVIDSGLILGNQVQVWGFVSSYRGASGLNQLALHAEAVKLINSGDEPNGTLFPPP